MADRVQGDPQLPYEGICQYAQKITSCFGLDKEQALECRSGQQVVSSVLSRMVSPLPSACNPRRWVEGLSMPALPNLSSLGRLCGSVRSEEIVLDRSKRRNSICRKSIIEDGHVAEVLYLVPKQSIMEQLPFLNPSDYFLCDSLMGLSLEPEQGKKKASYHHPF
ncbi:actin-binding LIM protein 1 [Arapaima gigas]